MSSPTPFRVQKFLRGLRYPAHKQAALEHASRCGADIAVLRAIETAREGVYDSPIALAREIGGASQRMASERTRS